MSRMTLIQTSNPNLPQSCLSTRQSHLQKGTPGYCFGWLGLLGLVCSHCMSWQYFPVYWEWVHWSGNALPGASRQLGLHQLLLFSISPRKISTYASTNLTLFPPEQCAYTILRFTRNPREIAACDQEDLDCPSDTTLSRPHLQLPTISLGMMMFMLTLVMNTKYDKPLPPASKQSTSYSANLTSPNNRTKYPLTNWGHFCHFFASSDTSSTIKDIKTPMKFISDILQTSHPKWGQHWKAFLIQGKHHGTMASLPPLDLYLLIDKCLHLHHNHLFITNRQIWCLLKLRNRRRNCTTIAPMLWCAHKGHPHPAPPKLHNQAAQGRICHHHRDPQQPNHSQQYLIAHLIPCAPSAIFNSSHKAKWFSDSLGLCWHFRMPMIFRPVQQIPSLATPPASTH